MALLIEFREHQYCPVIICDHCSQEIEQAIEGNYQWRPSDDRGRFTVFYTHKHCCHAFEHQRGGMWFAEELSALPTFLLNNLKLTAKASRQSALSSSRLGW